MGPKLPCSMARACIDWQKTHLLEHPPCVSKAANQKSMLQPAPISVCRPHFLSHLTWRRRKGPQMFMKYAGMTMEERDPPRRRMGKHHPHRRSPRHRSKGLIAFFSRICRHVYLFCTHTPREWTRGNVGQIVPVPSKALLPAE